MGPSYFRVVQAHFTSLIPFSITVRPENKFARKLSIHWVLADKDKPRILYHTCPEASTLRETRHCWMEWRNSQQCNDDDKARCAHDTYCRDGVICSGMAVEYTHYKYCNAAFTICTCHGRAGEYERKLAVRYPGPPHSDANAFRPQQQCFTKTWNVNTLLVNLNNPRTARASAN